MSAPTFQSFNKFVQIYYLSKSFTLGNVFCSFFNIHDVELSNEENDDVAISIIMSKYISDTTISKDDLKKLFKPDIIRK